MTNEDFLDRVWQITIAYVRDEVQADAAWNQITELVKNKNEHRND